jgi:hypothetical protein
MEVKEPAASALRLLDGVCGDQIIRVVYHEVEHEDGQAAYLEADRHSLDYGLELHLASGRAISFIWSWPVCYFLGVGAGDLSREFTGAHAIWDVSAVDPWPSLLERTIQAAYLSWFTSEEAEGAFALTAKLVVGPDAPIYVTLGVDGSADDHVEVLFSDAVARSHKRFIDASGVAG